MTKYVVDVGGNVGESQATKLGKYFSLMMRVDVPQDNVSMLTTALENMDDMNATVFATDDDTTEVLVNPEVGCKYECIYFWILTPRTGCFG